MARETCKETLLRKASDPTAHVAGVGLKVGGLRSSDTSYAFYEQPDAASLMEAAFRVIMSVFILFLREVFPC